MNQLDESFQGGENVKRMDIRDVFRNWAKGKKYRGSYDKKNVNKYIIWLKIFFFYYER